MTTMLAPCSLVPCRQLQTLKGATEDTTMGVDIQRQWQAILLHILN